jgi:type VI secretion system protein ImpK
MITSTPASSDLDAKSFTNSGATQDAAHNWPERVNPLVSAAQPLLLAAGILPRAESPESIAQLQQTLLSQLQQFTDTLAGSHPDSLDSARYALCALLDEVIVSTSWGGASWPQYSLLAEHYGEDFSGNEFFLRLEQAGKQRSQNTWLLEFYHLCLSLGYSGRFHRRRQTDASIIKLRSQLAALILQRRSSAAAPLSPPAPPPASRKAAAIPLWVIASTIAALTIAAHQGMAWYLARSSDPLLQAIQAIGR